ncbi:MAG TPA: type IV secretory system conjugative DNA transfer family protein, partial [Steroidobacteraceae bacterium]
IGFLSDPTRTVTQTMEWMLDTDHDPMGDGWPNPDGSPNYCHPVVAAAARDMLNKADEEKSGIVSTAISYLTLYRDPIVARNTAASDFAVSDLMNAQKPVSLYLVVPPSDKDRLRPLIRLIINQIVRGLTEKMEFKDGRSTAGYKHRLLLMLDEFPSLGKLDVFEESLAFIAGYGLKAYLIIQDISQLWTAYGKDESIFSNCHIRLAYAPNKIETAELLSKMTGTATIVKQQHSFSGSLYGSQNSVSTSIQETQRALLTPDEVMRLPAARKDPHGNVSEPGDMLIFVAGQTPIYGKQILYFLDPTFAARARITAPTGSDVTRPQTGESAPCNS